MQRITKTQTDRLRHIAQTWRGSEADLVWTMCGSEFHVHRIHSRLWQCYRDQRLIGASQNPDGAIGYAMRALVTQPTKTTKKLRHSAPARKVTMQPNQTDTKTVQQTEGGGTVASSALLGITPEQQQTINRINEMSHFDMCSLWRFAPSGHPYFDSTLPFADVFKARLFGHFGGFTPEISKALS